MEQFYAGNFTRAFANLVLISSQIVNERRLPESASGLPAQLNELAVELREVGLPTSAGVAEASAKRVEAGSMAPVQVSQQITCFADTVFAEMDRHVFMRVFLERVPWLDNPAIFGDAVATEFPRATREGKSAGRCYACDSGTAAVFHLMRALQFGLHALADRLGVPWQGADWGSIIGRLLEAVNALPRSDQQKQLLSEATVEFKGFKNAWRNHISHTDDQYPPSEAKQIMDNVGSYLRTLCKLGLREP